MQSVRIAEMSEASRVVSDRFGYLDCLDLGRRLSPPGGPSLREALHCQRSLLSILWPSAAQGQNTVSVPPKLFRLFN